jgi:hypothetical protein
MRINDRDDWREVWREFGTDPDTDVLRECEKENEYGSLRANEMFPQGEDVEDGDAGDPPRDLLREVSETEHENKEYRGDRVLMINLQRGMLGRMAFVEIRIYRRYESRPRFLSSYTPLQPPSPICLNSEIRLRLRVSEG